MTQTQSRKKNLFQMNVDLMHGPIFRSLVLFMLPILISNLFQQLYNTVDTMIVGNVLGDTALAAIGSCGAIYELLVGFGLGIGNGLAIVAARAYGAQDEDLLKRTVAPRQAFSACGPCWSCWTPPPKFWKMPTATSSSLIWASSSCSLTTCARACCGPSATV